MNLTLSSFYLQITSKHFKVAGMGESFPILKFVEATSPNWSLSSQSNLSDVTRIFVT